MIDSFAGFDETTFTAATELTLDLISTRYDPGAGDSSVRIEPRLISRDDVDPNGAGFVDVNNTQESVV